MPRKPRHETISGEHFRWILTRRAGVWYADGRGNTPKLGRHSLGTKDKMEAIQRVRELDLVQAVERGRADRSALRPDAHDGVGLRPGWDQYRKHLARPEVAGGSSARTRQRYAAILDKFIQFAEKCGVRNWAQVTAQLVSDYLGCLSRQDYAERTLYIEGTVVKQVMRWLAAEKLIPRESLWRLPLKKPRESTRYCYRPEEVAAMIAHCRQRPELGWLADVMLVLSRTGMRIGELAALRWSDVDLEHNVICITNERAAPAGCAAPRRTKNRRDRTLPMHAELRDVFQRLRRGCDSVVFHGPRGGRLKPDTVRNIFIAHVINPLKSSFPTPPGASGFEHGRLHSFRHFFCSRCANEGVPEYMVMNWLGHRDSQMIRHYYHLHDQEAQQQLKRVRFTGTSGSGVAAAAAPDLVEAPPSGPSRATAS